MAAGTGCSTSRNPLFIIIFAPFFAWIWVQLGARNLDPSAPVKLGLGLILLGVGFLVMMLAAQLVVSSGGKVGPPGCCWPTCSTPSASCACPRWACSTSPSSRRAKFVGQSLGTWFLGTAHRQQHRRPGRRRLRWDEPTKMPDQFMFIVWWGVIAGGVLLCCHRGSRIPRGSALDRRPQMNCLLSARRCRARASPSPLTGCSGPQGSDAAAEDRRAGVRRTGEQGLVELNREVNAAGWTQSTDITVDTQYLNARATERILEFFSRKAGEAKAYDNDKLDASTARSLKLIKLGVSAPAPADAAKRAELAALTTELEAMYGEGKYCPQGKTVRSSARTRRAARTSTSSATSSPPAATTTSSPKPGRAGTRSRGRCARSTSASRSSPTKARASSASTDLGVLWRSRYDMPAADFEKEAARLYEPGQAAVRRACTATRAASWRRSTARTRCRTASRSRRTCSATCGRSSGTASTTTC